MTRPHRIQLSRRRGWRKPEGAVVVSRPTRWGNPYQAGKDGDGGRAYLVQLYREYLARPEQADLVTAIRAELRGKDLACWCPLDQPCHADVLLEIANEYTAVERCHWYRDGDGEVLIPMCLGTAVNGPEQCTCNVPESRIERAERGRAEAERQVLRLREARDRRLDEQQKQWRQIKHLRARIRDLDT